jgi:hypothetical protein
MPTNDGHGGRMVIAVPVATGTAHGEGQGIA